MTAAARIEARIRAAVADRPVAAEDLPLIVNDVAALRPAGTDWFDHAVRVAAAMGAAGRLRATTDDEGRPAWALPAT